MSKNISINSPSQSPDDARHNFIKQWLSENITHSFRIESLPGDASFRRYHRIYLDTKNSETVYILMDAPPEKESIVEFVQVAELMKDTVNVPDIIARDITNGLLLLQDFGQTEFAHLLVDASEDQINQYYQQAISTLVNLQSIDTSFANIPPYDQALLLQEMELFTDWFIPYLDIKPCTHFTSIWNDLVKTIISEIQKQPQVFVHRDYHSRNLMMDRNDKDNLGIIDFQDAVVGSYTYDIVSLLRDAYVNWSEEQINQWLNNFWQLIPDDIKASDFNNLYQDFTIMGIQRHLKILGIFIRLSERDGKTRYLGDIPKVMRDLLFELRWLQQNSQGIIQSTAHNFISWIDEELITKYSNKFL